MLSKKIKNRFSMNKQRVIITGSEGFIGKHIVTKLESSEDFEVIKISRVNGSISEKNFWHLLPKAEILIHLAGFSSVPKSWENINQVIEINTLSTVNALDYCLRNKARMIFPSTFLYDNLQRMPVNELEEPNPQNPYALSKFFSEKLCTFYQTTYGVKTTVLRLFNVYGPGQANSFLIPSIINQLKRSNTVRVNDLKPKRDYIYIEDVVDAFVSLLNQESISGIYNIGSGVSHSVKDIISIISSVMNKKPLVTQDGSSRKSEIKDVIANISMAREVLSWEPKVSLKNGIKKTICQ